MGNNQNNQFNIQETVTHQVKGPPLKLALPLVLGKRELFVDKPQEPNFKTKDLTTPQKKLCHLTTSDVKWLCLQLCPYYMPSCSNLWYV
jgi:hypothetical protein